MTSNVTSRNFIMSIDPTQEAGKYSIEIVDASSRMNEGTLDLDFEFEDLVPSLRKFGLLVDEESQRPDSKKPQRTWTPLDLGAGLFEVLFQDPDIAASWYQAHGAVDGKIRLILKFDADKKEMDHLARLPWELMLDPKHPLPLVRQSGVTLARMINQKANHKDEVPVLPSALLRMLVVIANPSARPGEKELDTIDVDSVRSNLKKSLNNLGIEVHFLDPPTKKQLRHELRQGAYHFVHFFGHGGFDEREWCIDLENVDGETDTLTTGAMVDLLARQENRPRLITLVSCSSGTLERWSDFNPFGGVACALLQAGVDHVVAMQHPISIDSARAFSDVFYAELIKTKNLDHSLSEARHEIYQQKAESLEWAVPVWFTRSVYGDLYREPDWQTLHLNTIESNLNRYLVTQGRSHVDCCDWAKDFEKRAIKDPENWKTKYLQYFQNFKGALPTDCTHVAIEGRANLSMWMALGFVFNKTSGKELVIKQINQSEKRPRVEIWRTDYGREEMSINPDPQEDFTGGSDLVFSVSISQDTRKDVRPYLKKTGLSVKKWVDLAPIMGPGHESIAGAEEALGLAYTTARKIREICGDPAVAGARQKHLFIAAPSAFAAFLGRELNAIGNLQLYSHIGVDYEPSFLLERY